MSFEDLFDIGRRPGSGLELWTAAVDRQLERVSDANYRHRLHNSPDPDEKVEDEHAEAHLHADLYFLVLAIRRVLLFHDALADQVSDPRLVEARAKFDEIAPHAKDFRDFYEHLDRYLLGTGNLQRSGRLNERVSPRPHSYWRKGNVELSFGSLRMDVTHAATAAVELGKVGQAVWSDEMDRVKGQKPEVAEPPDDGVPRKLELTFGISTTIGDATDDPPEINTGTLLDVDVREYTEAELAAGEHSVPVYD